MNYTVEMGSGALIYVPSFITITAIQKLIRGIHTDTHPHPQQFYLIIILLFFQNEESKLVKSVYYIYIYINLTQFSLLVIYTECN
jgi:hypothetical protein